MPEILKYTEEELRVIRTATHFQHPSNYLSNFTISWIIALGIKRKPVDTPYRRSRAGKSLFKKIHAIISNNIIYRTSKNFRNESNLNHTQPIPSNHFRLTLSHANIRSIRNKIWYLQEQIQYMKFDICAISETWLKAESEEPVHNKAPPGYNLISLPRMDGHIGGGIALLYKSSLNVTKIHSLNNPITMECSTFTVKSDHTNLTSLVIYEQPTSSTITFCEELATILEGITSMKSNIMIIGDFNIHIENIAKPDTITFNDFLDSFNLQNHVIFPTHIAKHHLDLCITEWDWGLFQSISKDHLISYHNFIHFKLRAPKPYVSTKRISYRKLKNINNDLFKIELSTNLMESLNSISSHSARDLVEVYNNACTKTLTNMHQLKRKS